MASFPSLDTNKQAYLSLVVCKIKKWKKAVLLTRSFYAGRDSGQFCLIAMSLHENDMIWRACLVEKSG